MSDPLPEPARPCPGAALYLADCREVLPLMPAGSFDLVFTDPPYPCIKREYGTWTEAEWWEMMRAVVPECMRLLKPSGSAVFVLQPNSERVGRMRTWHLEFELWLAKTWGIVQDFYWWNPEALTVGGSTCYGLCRPSVKRCAWVGPEDCYRNQAAVMWGESQRNRAMRLVPRATRSSPSGRKVNNRRMGEAALRRGGVTPFNLLPAGGCNRWDDGGGIHGHGASTPFVVCDFFVRYLCPPGGTVLDPFSGSGTVGVVAAPHGCGYVGVEVVPEYHATARRRLAEAAGPLFATPLPSAGG